MLRQSTQTSTGAPAMLAAPVFLLVYGVIRHLSHHRSPSVGWTLGHSAWLIGLILFAVALPWLRAQAAGWPRTSTALFWLAAAGLVASVAQASVDIVAGLLADDHAGMVRISGQVKAIPGVELFVYKLGPA